MASKEYSFPVSVIMSTYKEPIPWLEESIDSILNQSFSNFEFIIVNDNPKREELTSFLLEKSKTDPRIKLFQNEENKGLIYSLNRAIDFAKGKYYLRMDADDISRLDRVQLQFDYMEQHQEIGVCGTMAVKFGASTDKIVMPQKDEELRLFSIQRSPFIHPSVIMRASLFEDGLRYSKNDLHAEDYGLWVRLMEQTKFHNLDQDLLQYRQSDIQISHGNLVQKTKAKEIRRRAVGVVFGANILDLIGKDDKISLRTIKKVQNELRASKQKQRNSLLVDNLFLSLHKVRLNSIIQYMLTTSCNQKVMVKLLKRIFVNPESNFRF